MYKKLTKLAALPACAIALASPISSSVNAAEFFTFVPGADRVTPSQYSVTINQIHLRDSNNNWATISNSPISFDLAAINPNSDAGTIGAGVTIPAGAYNQMQIRFSSRFNVTAATANAGSNQPCETSSSLSNTTSLNGGSISNVSLGSATANGASSQVINIPTGVNHVFSNSGTNELMLTVNTSPILIEENGELPDDIRLSFDVTNAVELSTTGAGSCVIIVHPPAIGLSTGLPA